MGESLTATVATIYIVGTGAALFCGMPAAIVQEPWIALPEGDNWQCGDLIYLHFVNGSTLMARALDSGPFSAYCVRQPDGTCLPIATDIPAQYAPFPGLSVGIEQMYNITAEVRRYAH